MKNHTDVLIFHTAICAGASQIAMMADEKSPSRISRRLLRVNAPEWRLIWQKEADWGKVWIPLYRIPA